MGLGNSRPALLSYPQAAALLTPEERKALKDFWKKLLLADTSSTELISNRKSIPPQLFSLIEGLVPASLNAQICLIFKELHPLDVSIKWEDFMVVVATACKSTQNDLIGICFRLFDRNYDGFVDENEMKTTLLLLSDIGFSLSLDVLHLQSKKLVFSSKQDREEMRNKVVQEMCQDAISKSRSKQRLTYADFTQWIAFLHDLPLLIRFLLSVMIGTNPEQIPVELEGCSLPQPLKRIGKIELMDEALGVQLKSWLPLPYRRCQMLQIFSSSVHGRSLNLLYHNISKKPRQLLDGCVLVIRSSDNRIFGVFCTEMFNPHHRGSVTGYGSPETFVFSFSPPSMSSSSDPSSSSSDPSSPDPASSSSSDPASSSSSAGESQEPKEKVVSRHYQCQSLNGAHSKPMHTTFDYLAIGVDNTANFSFVLDGMFRGQSKASKQFGAPMLTSGPEFFCETLELWGFFEDANYESILYSKFLQTMMGPDTQFPQASLSAASLINAMNGTDVDDDSDPTARKTVEGAIINKGVLGRTNQTYVLEMLGGNHGYSQNLD